MKKERELKKEREEERKRKETYTNCFPLSLSLFLFHWGKNNKIKTQEGHRDQRGVPRGDEGVGEDARGLRPGRLELGLEEPELDFELFFFVFVFFFLLLSSQQRPSCFFFFPRGGN